MNTDEFKKILCASALGLIDQEGLLTSLDSKIGDGDHGVSITKLSRIILDGCVAGNDDLAALLEWIAGSMTNCGSSSAGPLWGTYFEGLAASVAGASDLGGKELAEMLASGCRELCSVSAARIGDKTMMDAVIPSVEAAETKAKSGGSAADVLRAAADAAIEGAGKTEDMVARFGRAKNLKERSLGCRDAGAVSFSLFLRGLADAVEAQFGL